MRANLDYNEHVKKQTLCTVGIRKLSCVHVTEQSIPAALNGTLFLKILYIYIIK